MLRSLLRLFITSIFLSIRTGMWMRRRLMIITFMNRLMKYRLWVYSIKFGFPKRYTLINYNNWFLPNGLNVEIYKADLKYLVNGKVVKAFTDYYPLLGLGVMALDPLYPLLMVAYKHLDIFLTKEHKL